MIVFPLLLVLQAAGLYGTTPVLLDRMLVPAPITSLAASGHGAGAPAPAAGLARPGGLMIIDVEGGAIGLSAAFPGFGCLDIARGSTEEEGLLLCLDSGTGLLHLREGSGLRVHPPGCASRPEHAVFAGPDSCRTGMILVADHHTGVVALSDLSGNVLFEVAVRGAKAAVPSDLDADGDIDMVVCGCYEGTGGIENDDGSFGSVIQRMDPE